MVNDYYNKGYIYTGPEPMVRPVRFWPDHFLPGVHSLLVANYCMGLAFTTKPLKQNSLVIVKY